MGTEQKIVLDWGCGDVKVPGAVGMDNARLPGVDLVHDLMDVPYPFEDSTADEIHLNHVIEHFALADVQKILSEAYRILRPQGILHVRVPHVFSIAAWADPTHKSAFTFITGRFFDSRSPKAYYKELDHTWELARTCARVTWFDWKRYRLRQLDNWLSQQIGRWLNWLLQRENWVSGADWVVRALPMFFVEIQWDLQKRAER